VLSGPQVLGIISVGQIEELRFVDEVALGFIGLAAGGKLRLLELRSMWRSVIKLAVALLLAQFAMAFAACLALAQWDYGGGGGINPVVAVSSSADGGAGAGAAEAQQQQQQLQQQQQQQQQQQLLAAGHSASSPSSSPGAQDEFFMVPMSLDQRVAVAGLVASLMAACSPSSALAVVDECRARGRYTSVMMVLTY